MAQLVGIVTLLVWAFGFSYVLFRVQNASMGIRFSGCLCDPTP
jgi:ammonia channel protein AmtB